MKRSGWIILLSVLVALLLIGGIIFIKTFLPKYNWIPNYQSKSKEPYGCSLLVKILKKSDVFQEFKPISKPPYYALPEKFDSSIYVFIGYVPYYDSLNFERVLSYVSAGNSAFLSLEELPDELARRLLITSDTNKGLEFFSDSMVTIQTIDNRSPLNFKFHFQQYKKISNYSWAYVSTHRLLDSAGANNNIPLSQVNEGRINFWKTPYGKGTLYVHTNPLVFTNYNMVSESGYQHLNFILNSIGKHRICYWDDYSKNWNNSEGTNPLFTIGPLSYLLSQRSLKIAYYLSLGLILIYTIAKSRRIQRAVPLQEENKNTSIQFAETIGLLHYRNSKASDLGHQLMSLFTTYVRQRYGISIQLSEEDYIAAIAKKAELNIESIQRIYKTYFILKYDSEPDSRHVIELHGYLEYFYKNCK